MVRGCAMAVIAVALVYQWAETARMARGRGSVRPSAAHDSVYRLRSNAFIGLPWPMNSTGIGSWRGADTGATVARSARGGGAVDELEGQARGVEVAGHPADEALRQIRRAARPGVAAAHDAVQGRR